MDIELCVGSFDEALLAQEFLLKRIELCSALEVGGLTPNAGLIKQCVQIHGPETHVMIRPRAGDFIYTEHEISIMLEDIRTASSLGAHGVVFGALTESNHLDKLSLKLLSEEARSLRLETTFHRAFDLTEDPLEAMEHLIDLRFDRILTSGQQAKAVDGIELIKELIDESQGRIQIMAGSGINAENAGAFADIKVDAIHFTARKKVPSETHFGMGDRYEPDQNKVQSILSGLHDQS